MIRVLDKFVSDKIAAGEVIERPVSAVKELIENSMDAGATSIITEIRGGGRSYIRVTDNGCGIPSDEVETAFLRHATSKIESVRDLDNITTLGFRGEALASIAAVSKVTMVTRTAGSPSGVRIILHGGKVVSRETVGTNPGTTIIVDDLFYNTPARRKFMGSDTREGSAVIELVQQYAVCRSDIRFMMVRNGETVFTTSGSGDILDAVRTIYPDPDHSGLISISGEGVTGYISDPGTTRSNRKGQLFFVNGRLVSSPVIEKGLEKGYGGRIFSGFPVAVLFIDEDPAAIDVNIHPGKREVRFLRADSVETRISDAVRQAMDKRSSVPAGVPARAHDPKQQGTHVYEEVRNEPMFTGEQSSIRDYLAGMSRPETPEAEPETAGDTEHSGLSAPAEAAPVAEPVRTLRDQPFRFEELVFKGYVFDTYIIMEGDEALYVFDQHAAHERINYERFVAAYRSSDQIPQPVLTPITLHVSSDVYYTGRERLDDLRRMGYDIEDFGLRSFIIRGIPSYVTAGEADTFARSFLEDTSDTDGLNRTVIDKLIMRSCKASVKAGGKLSAMEIEELLNSLSECADPYCCPHGRPTFIRYSKYDIERSFRRK